MLAIHMGSSIANTKRLYCQHSSNTGLQAPNLLQNIVVLGRKARFAACLPAYGGQATIYIHIKKDKSKIIYEKGDINTT
jgi:hypothetical protein